MADVNVLLHRLDKVKSRGNKHVARCPAHDDKTPSLSITELADTRVVIHCQAGCGAIDVLSAVGLDYDDLLPNDQQLYRSLVSQHNIKPRRRVQDYAVDLALNAGPGLSDSDRQKAKLAVMRGGESFGWCDQVRREASKPMPSDDPNILDTKEGHDALMTELNHYLNTEHNR